MENVTSGRVKNGCKVCDETKTVHSHLLPRAFALDARRHTPALRAGSIFKSGYHLTQAGIFDDGILCDKHEKMLHASDTYGVEFCREFYSHRKALGHGSFLVGPINSNFLVRFALSVVWRFAVSTRPEAGLVDLGDFEPLYRDVVFHGADCSSEPAVIIYGNNSVRHDLKQIIAQPSRGRQRGRRYWSFMVGGVTFITKADRRPVPADQLPPPINGLQYFITGDKPFEGSAEQLRTLRIALNMAEPSQRPTR